MEGKHVPYIVKTALPISIFSVSFVMCLFGHSSFSCFTDHCVRSGVLPGQAYGVHRLLPEHHGVWHGEHPFPEG